MKDKKIKAVKKVLNEFVKAGWLIKIEVDGKIYYQEIKDNYLKEINMTKTNLDLYIEEQKRKDPTLKEVLKKISKETDRDMKIYKLKKDLGVKLFNQLSKEQKDLVIKTAGVIKAGKINIQEIYDEIDGY